MADVIFDIDALMGDMTDEEAAAIFKPTTRRAPNFERYQLALNAQQIGARKHIDIPAGTADPEQSARELRYNLNEAAKERTVWKPMELNADEKAQYDANKKIDRFEREVAATDDTPAHTVVLIRTKDGWRTEVKEPVILRWKMDTREEQREVEKDGKKVMQTVKVPTRLYYVSVATEAIRRRAPRAKTEDKPATEGQTVEGEKQAALPVSNGEVKEPVAA